MGAKERSHTKTYTLAITENYYYNLAEIVDYIALVNKQPANALKIADGINRTLNKIVRNPFIYAQCENLPTKTKLYREALYKTWLIVFKIVGYEVIILGVLSCKQASSAFMRVTKRGI